MSKFHVDPSSHAPDPTALYRPVDDGAGAYGIQMRVDDRVPYVVGIETRLIAIAALENVPFHVMPALDQQGRTTQYTVHDPAKRLPALSQDDVEMVGHDRVRKQISVTPVDCGSDGRHDRVPYIG